MSKTCTYNIKVNYANRNEKERKYTVNKKLTNVILTESAVAYIQNKENIKQGLNLHLSIFNDEFHTKSSIIYATE